MESNVETVKQEFRLVSNDASSLVLALTELFTNQEIKDEADLIQAADALAQIRDFFRRVEAKRKEMVKPANDFVTHINSTIKAQTEAVMKEDTRLKNLMSAYRARIAQARQEQYAENQKKAAEFFVEGSPIPETIAPVPEDTTRQVATSVGSVHFTTIWKWDIANLDCVPSKYFVLDEALISKLVRAGERDIPGIHIYSEEVPVSRAR